jgi:hypothetical protein
LQFLFTPYLIGHSAWCLGMTYLGSCNLTISWLHNRLVVLTVTLTHPATTAPYRLKMNIHNIMDWLYP